MPIGNKVYIINTRIPKRHYKKIWEKNFPDMCKIFGECMFEAHNTYGIAKTCIDKFYSELIDKLSSGEDVRMMSPFRKVNQ